MMTPAEHLNIAERLLDEAVEQVIADIDSKIAAARAHIAAADVIDKLRLEPVEDTGRSGGSVGYGLLAERIGDEWVATCNHGHEGVWTVHRASEYLALRSLRAHKNNEHPDVDQ